ncbi:hypothetical protein APP_36780 [Aeribacillus pallidus]|nr:hypothetical protein APP_36780 [Aeribacillus pallidus]
MTIVPGTFRKQGLGKPIPDYKLLRGLLGSKAQLTFLSNAFVPVKTMPDWLQWFAKINPVSHIITAVRDLINAGTIGSDFAVSLIGATAIVAIFAPITVRVYMRRA